MLHATLPTRAGLQSLRKHEAICKRGLVKLADTYARRTGKTSEEMLALMAAETWYTGTEAVEIGLADRVMEGVRRALRRSGTCQRIEMRRDN